MRDSAGITIVENDADRPLWREGEAWRIDPEPVVQIGTVDGDPAQQLYRVTHARRLRDGTIAVVNSGTSEVRLYDAAGRHLRTIGRDGDGPGEFRSPWKVHELPGDSLLVIDLYREISIFGPDRRFVRRFPLAAPGDALRRITEPVDQFGDGTLLFRGHFPEDPGWVGVRRNRIRMLRYDLDGRLLGSLGDFDDQTVRYGPGGRYAFGAWAHEVAADSTMWYGSGDVFELREVAFDGRVLRLVRLDRAARPVTEEDIADYREYMLEMFRRQGQEALGKRILAETEFAETLPVHFALQVDDVGNLWVMEYQPSGDLLPLAWSVFDTGGHYLGDVVVPAGLRVHQIGEDFILGLWRDELDVEYVRMYRIVKPGA